ncbi:sugar ABC transporter substrate-binding protein [Butyrivibrio sp. CB08]|uniref:ABC transporter substrate-binding protein n=1 Tax=Butyrivibrio sp. CB08 TaxID=2364879 RepID=UPI000EA90D1A|nr:extracellular solute-binding protein [Butyrivibrio sp. CB08]RKM62377.1 sugar ABC transporter substrate-binding protein [Butyrivibrio sp. CB08]
MKRKALSIFLASAMSLSLLAGCGGAADTAATTTDAGQADAPAATEAAAPTADVASEGEHELSVYAWDKNFNIPALEAAEKAYQTVDPEFKLNIVEQSASSDVENAITLAASSGDYSQLPDIVLFQDHYIQNYVTNYPDAWMDLEDAGIDWSDFGAEKLSYSTVGGKHYGAPVDNGTSVFAYRTDVLEECGYTIDDVTGITWDEWLEIGRVVKEKTGKYLVSMDHNGDDLPYMMMQAEGQSQWKDGEPNFVNNDTLKQILEVIITGAKDGVIYLCNDWSEYTDTSIIGDQVAGVFNGNWIIPTMEQVSENSGKWAITTAPTLSGKEGYAANGGSSLYVTGNCSKPELAKAFLAYTFGGGEGAMATYDDALRNGGVITCCISASKSSVYQEGVDFFNGQSIYSDIVAMGANVPVVEQNDYHYTARTQIQAAITNVINGSDLETELKNAEDQVRFEMGL